MQDEWDARRNFGEPRCAKRRVCQPIRHGHLFKSSGTLTDAAIVEA
jgi:hypothetical protein